MTGGSPQRSPRTTVGYALIGISFVGGAVLILMSNMLAHRVGGGVARAVPVPGVLEYDAAQPGMAVLLVRRDAGVTLGQLAITVTGPREDHVEIHASADSIRHDEDGVPMRSVGVFDLGDTGVYSIRSDSELVGLELWVARKSDIELVAGARYLPWMLGFPVLLTAVGVLLVMVEKKPAPDRVPQTADR